VPASLQALLRLATLRWLGVFICALATLLATTSTASALEPAQTKTRVWGFDFAEHNSSGLFRAASSGKHQGNRLARAEAASGSLLAAEGGLVASDGINGSRLASDLVRAEAESAFTATGELSSEALQGSRQIIAPGELGNSAIPQGFGKYATETFNSPSGPFQAHFYMNPTTNEVFYGLDYKAIFNAGAPSRFVPAIGLAP
jgi:hypothetical protein